MAKRGAAVLEMPGPEYGPESMAPRTSGRPGGRSRRDPVEDFADGYPEERERSRSRSGPRTAPAPRTAVTLRLGSRLPKTTAGLVATAIALLGLLAVVLWLLAVTRTFLLHDARFQVASASSIEIGGNRHLTRPQLLGLFADDLGRDIFRVSLDERRAELEAIPWVERATVMRLLPNRLRVSLVERTPVAFVREGGHVGMVDSEGVLLPMLAGGGTPYSFPVVTGILASDPLSTRAARMKLYGRFVAELDGPGEKNTDNLSEVDLSNPEDLRAEIEEHGVHVLVHFGEGEFLQRYRRVKQLLPEWHAQYPNLASADMRYEHEIPLAMAAPVVAKNEAAAGKAAAKPAGAKATIAAPHVAALTPHSAPTGHPPIAMHPPAAAVLKAKTGVPAAGVAPGPVSPKAIPVADAAQGFVPPPVSKPWEAVPFTKPVATVPASHASPGLGAARPSLVPIAKPVTAPVSVSAAARAQFVAKPGTSNPQPSKPTVSKAAGGKPSAGKVLIAPIPPSDSSVQTLHQQVNPR